MNMSKKLSIIIPSRSPQYLKKTVNDLLSKAEGEVEVLIIFDGIWPDDEEMPDSDKRVKFIHHGSVHDSPGMRASINKGMAVAQGDYVMKIDEHCMVDQGYDKKLMADCNDDWVVIPRRKRLDAEKWENVRDGRPDIDYMKIDYPYAKPYDKTQGLHGSIWHRPERADILIDDVMTCQGSCYFMKKSYWEELFPDGMEDDKYGPFTQEAQELTNKAWLSGGRVVVNKKTWYSHLHKGSKGKGYSFSTSQYKRHCEWNEKGRVYCINYWLYTKDYKYDFEWMIKKFWPLPGWPEDWKERIEEDRKKDYSTLKYENDFWCSNLKGQDITNLGK